MKNQKSIEELKAEIARAESERTQTFAQIEPLEKKASRLYNKIEKLNDELTVLVIEKEPDWNWVLEEDGNSKGHKHYQYCEKRIAELGLMTGGFLRDIKQRCIRIALVNGKPESIVKIEKGLKTILPYVKPMTEGDYKGYKYISIFEHTLSESYSYVLAIKKDEYSIFKISYRSSKITSFKNLHDALVYIYDNLWYERLDSNGQRLEEYAY